MQYVKTDMRRAFTSWGFWTALSGMVLAILIGAAGDIVNLIDNGAKEGLQSGFHARLLLLSLSSDVMLLCVPVLAALPYTSAFVDDLKSGFLKGYLPRSGKNKYVGGKVAATALTGGSALFLGIMISYFIFALVFTPMENVVRPGETAQPAFPPVLQSACIFFLCGGLWSLVGALFAAATMSRYMAYSSPFIIYYVLVILSERYLKSIYVLNPKQWLTAADVWPGGKWGDAAFLAVLIAALALGLAYSISRRLSDA